MSTLKEQIAASITPLQLSALATIAGRDGLNVRGARSAGSRKVAQRAADPEVEP